MPRCQHIRCRGLLSSIVGAFAGAPAPSMALGCMVMGASRDSVPRTLMLGEFVLKRSAVNEIGRETLGRMNTMGRA